MEPQIAAFVHGHIYAKICINIQIVYIYIYFICTAVFIVSLFLVTASLAVVSSTFYLTFP